MKSTDKEMFNELIDELLEQEDAFKLYFLCFYSENISREDCEKKLEQLEMMEEYFTKKFEKISGES